MLRIFLVLGLACLVAGQSRADCERVKNSWLPSWMTRNIVKDFLYPCKGSTADEFWNFFHEIKVLRDVAKRYDFGDMLDYVWNKSALNIYTLLYNIGNSWRNSVENEMIKDSEITVDNSITKQHLENAKLMARYAANVYYVSTMINPRSMFNPLSIIEYWLSLSKDDEILSFFLGHQVEKHLSNTGEDLPGFVIFVDKSIESIVLAVKVRIHAIHS